MYNSKINGWVLSTIEGYEEKQKELSDNYNINNVRYAGMIINGVTVPDVQLINGGYFMRDIYNLGNVNIEFSDILQPKLI